MKLVHFLRKFTIMIFSICLFLTIIAIIVLTATKNMISKESIADYIQRSDVLELKIGTLFKIDNPQITKASTFRETIIVLADDAGIPKLVVDDMIETNELNKLLGDLLNGVINYAIIGGDKPAIAEETINRFTEVANRSLESHIGIVMEPEELSDNITKYVDELIRNVPNREVLIKNISQLDTLRHVLTFNVVYLYILMGAIVIALGLLLYSWYRPMKYLGIIVLICGVFFTVLGSLQWPIYNLIKNNIYNMEAIIHPLLDKVLFICFEQGVIYTIVGIFLIIGFVVINRFVRNKRVLDEKTKQLKN